jgi:hypothetical protein
MTATSDAILAVGPIAVALAAIGATTWQQRRGFKHQREMADLSDLRALFDEAAAALHQASLAGHEVELWLHDLDWAPATATPERQRGVLAGGFAAGEVLRSLRGRLGVRLDADHDAVKAFEAARDAAELAVGTASQLTWDEALDRDTAEGVVLESHERMHTATDDFMRAASRTVGARLPS